MVMIICWCLRPAIGDFPFGSFTLLRRLLLPISWYFVHSLGLFFSLPLPSLSLSLRSSPQSLSIRRWPNGQVGDSFSSLLCGFWRLQVAADGVILTAGKIRIAARILEALPIGRKGTLSVYSGSRLFFPGFSFKWFHADFNCCHDTFSMSRSVCSTGILLAVVARFQPTGFNQGNFVMLRTVHDATNTYRTRCVRFVEIKYRR